MIKISLAGKIGSPAQVKEANGKKFISFSAYSSYKKKDGTYESTFVNCTYFTDKADIIAPFLTKGKGVYVEGEPKARSYTDKDGNNVAVLDCIVRQVELCGDSRSEGASTPNAGVQPQQATPNIGNNGDTDDMPF